MNVYFRQYFPTKTTTDVPFVHLLRHNDVVPGIKVDKGTIDLAGTNGETTIQGLDSIGARCHHRIGIPLRYP
ncbi:Fructose-bisphosphate aldolase 5, cytosolic, partial [Sarracenia purpurea var. burkii]